MKVHYPGSKSHTAHADNPHILLADHGSSVFLGALENSSSWNGVSFLDLNSYDLVKVLHDITSSPHPEVAVIRPGSVERLSHDLGETFFMHDRLFCYHAHGDADVAFTFDIRDIYDFSTDGREHTIEVISESPYIIRVTSRGKSFALCASLPGITHDTWLERDTPFDERRGESSSWWVFGGLSFPVRGDLRVVVAPYSRLSEARSILSADHLWSLRDDRWDDVVPDVAHTSLTGLITRTPSGHAGILAGLPWFFQIYTRDEAIALGALILRGDALLAARILLREISLILPDGRIPNRFPSSDTGSADGVGWSFLRLHEIFLHHRHALTAAQWTFVLNQLKISLSRLSRVDGLVVNGPQETWMDTTGGSSDTREGARIEIQALTLRMLRLCQELSEALGDHDADKYRVEEQSLLRVIRKKFYDKKHHTLFDGVINGSPDDAQRPNALLTLYIYPWLLATDEWLGVARPLVSSLQTSWGGFSSISSSNPLFCAQHSGSNDKSYHRGDSWFFMNNLIAVALLRLSPEFEDVARAVYDASVRDLLTLGAVGHSSEISSASVQEPLGCWCQAWSASSLLELHHSF